jgi:transcriptional regulator with XRE-family HTH domain
MDNKLRVLRAERRISQVSLATTAGIHPTRLWRLENGYVDPTAHEREAIALALGVPERKVWHAARSREAVV